MRATCALVVGLMMAGCTGGDSDRSTLDLGRSYTQWMFAGDFDKLWARFTPEMQRTFATRADLEQFVGRTAQELGHEKGQASERTSTAAGTRVYSRTASFDRAPRPVEIQWSLAPDGRVTGMFVRPVPADSARADSAGPQ